jgi:hypothetical protein
MEPLISDERYCINNKKYPIDALLYIDSPTLDIINIGLDIFTKLRSLCESIDDISLLSYSIDTVFAAIGQPEKRLVIITKPDPPPVLNILSMKGARTLPIKIVVPRACSKFITIINGSREGIIVLNHSSKPDFAALVTGEGYIIIKIFNTITNKGIVLLANLGNSFFNM